LIRHLGGSRKKLCGTVKGAEPRPKAGSILVLPLGAHKLLSYSAHLMSTPPLVAPTAFSLTPCQLSKSWTPMVSSWLPS